MPCILLAGEFSPLSHENERREHVLYPVVVNLCAINRLLTDFVLGYFSAILIDKGMYNV